jgi:hypothetical protein
MHIKRVMEFNEIGVSFECFMFNAYKKWSIQLIVNEIRIAYMSVGQIPPIVSTHSSIS